MRDKKHDNSFERMLIIGGILLILLASIVNGEHTISSVPTPSIDSHNIYTETHTTNIDVCGICIDIDN
jgi:hypothetical protein